MRIRRYRRNMHACWDRLSGPPKRDIDGPIECVAALLKGVFHFWSELV